MMKGYYIFILIMASCFLYSCPPRAVQQEDIDTVDAMKEKISENKDCDTHVIVQDATGMDGCRFLFVLNNGDKLLPNEMPLMDFELAGNQLLKISYDIVRDGVSACMMESQIIKVNCIEFITQTGGVKPAKKACVKADNYPNSKWLKSIASDMEPYQITRFPYRTDGWAYMIDNGRQKKLIDCQGSEICTVLGKAAGPCYEKIQNLGEGKVIYSKNDERND